MHHGCSGTHRPVTADDENQVRVLLQRTPSCCNASVGGHSCNPHRLSKAVLLNLEVDLLAYRVNPLLGGIADDYDTALHQTLVARIS